MRNQAIVPIVLVAASLLSLGSVPLGFIYSGDKIDEAIQSPHVTISVVESSGTGLDSLRIVYSGDGPRFVPVFEHIPHERYGYGILEFFTYIEEGPLELAARPQNRVVMKEGQTLVVDNFSRLEDRPYLLTRTFKIPGFRRPSAIIFGLHFTGPGEIEVGQFRMRPNDHPYGLIVALIVLVSVPFAMTLKLVPEIRVRRAAVRTIRRTAHEWYIFVICASFLGHVVSPYHCQPVLLAGIAGLLAVGVTAALRAGFDAIKAEQRKSEPDGPSGTAV